MELKNFLEEEAYRYGGKNGIYGTESDFFKKIAEATIRQLVKEIEALFAQLESELRNATIVRSALCINGKPSDRLADIHQKDLETTQILIAREKERLLAKLDHLLIDQQQYTAEMEAITQIQGSLPLSRHRQSIVYYSLISFISSGEFFVNNGALQRLSDTMLPTVCTFTAFSLAGLCAFGAHFLGHSFKIAHVTNQSVRNFRLYIYPSVIALMSVLVLTGILRSQDVDWYIVLTNVACIAIAIAIAAYHADPLQEENNNYFKYKEQKDEVEGQIAKVKEELTSVEDRLIMANEGTYLCDVNAIDPRPITAEALQLEIEQLTAHKQALIAKLYLILEQVEHTYKQSFEASKRKHTPPRA